MKTQVKLSLFLLILLFSSCTYEPLVIKEIGNIKFKSMNNNIVSIEATIDVKNPNEFSTKIKNIEFDLFTNEKLIGTLRNTKDQVFEPKSEGKYMLSLEIEVVDIISGISNVLAYIKKSENISEKLYIEGYISGFNGKIPFKKKVKTDLAEILK